MAESHQTPVQTAFVSSRSEEGGKLKFQLINLNVSYANGLRRTILSDIPTLGFKAFPHSENQVDIKTNTSRFNNEILKQRIASVPIHINDHGIPFHDLEVTLDMKNTTQETMNVTTGDFKITNTVTNDEWSTTAVNKVFPPDPMTGDHILLVRLRPKISDELPGEELQMKARMSLVTAGYDGVYAAASTCSYGFTPDKAKQQEEWEKKRKGEEEHLVPGAGGKKEGKEEGTKDIELLQENWFAHEAKRYFIPNSFEFVVESIGVFTNQQLVVTALDILLEQMVYIQKLAEDTGLSVKKSASTIPNSYDMRLDGVGYTVGKMLESELHNGPYRQDEILSYVGFRKAHPHDSDSVIRIGFADSFAGDKAMISRIIVGAITQATSVLNGLKEDFA